MLKPRPLRPGDRLAVVAPASPFARDELERGLQELRALGFEPVVDAAVFEHTGYVCGSAEARASAFRRAWQDPGVAGLIGARGGYGSAHLLPGLDADLLRRTPKPFIGYSDLTSLLTFLTVQCSIVGFHGPTVAGRLGRADGGYDRESFLRALTDANPLGELALSGLETLRPGEASGVLLGGTLSQILASLGTPFAFAPPRGYVLLADEVNERPYRLDRMLTQLRQAGLLGRASAVVFGELPGCDEPGGEPRARTAVADCLRDFPGPVLAGVPTGHTTGPAYTLPLGVRVTVAAGRHPKLVVEEAGVA